MEAQNPSVIRQTVKGVVALISRTVLFDIITTGTSLVIFSILTQSEVGIYTIVIAIQRVISFFADFGFGAALVQKKDDLTSEDLRTTFTLQASLTGGIFLLVLLLHTPISSFFKLSQSAFQLLAVLVFTIFLSSFKTIPSIILERKIHFHTLIIPQLVETTTFSLLLLVMVLSHFGLSAYTWAFLVSSIISIPFYFWVAPWEIGLGVNKASLSHLKFGLQFQIKNVLATIKDDFLTVILAKFLTFSQIGYIGFAQNLTYTPYRYFVDSITRVTFSSYARLQDNKDLLRQVIEKSLFFVSLIMFPILTGIILASPYIIHYFPHWNHKWEPAITSILFFSLNAMISSLSGILVNVLDSNGKVKWTLRLMVVWTTLTWIFTPLFIFWYGYNGVAAASFVVTLTIVYTIYLVKKIVNFDFLKSIYQSVIGTVIMGIVFYFLAPILVNSLLAVILLSLFCGALYFIIIYLLVGDEVMKDVRMLLKR